MALPPTSVVIGLTAGLLSTFAFAGGPEQPTFVDETASRLDSPADVGSADSTEKDYALADFDLDGDLDLVVARRTGLNGNGGVARPNTFFLNDDGVLRNMTAALAPDLLGAERSRDVLATDVDGDGWPDVIVADGPAETPKLLLNQGEIAGVWQGLAASTGMPPTTLDAWTISAGDLTGDGDGFPDLFIGVRTGNDRIYVNLGEDAGVWQGFADESTTRLGSNANTSAVRSSEIADMNGDGDLDIVEGITFTTGAVRLLSNNGAGVFTSAPQTVISGSAYNCTVGDLDGDGSLDMVGVRNGTDQYRLNQGSAGETVTFGSAVSFPNSSGFGSITRVADLNCDGLNDVLVCDLDQEFPQDCARRLKIFFNTGTAPLFVEGYAGGADWTPNGTSDVAIFDIDGDGDLDMFIGHCGGQSVFLKPGSPAILGDVDGDGSVNVNDLIAVLGAWGACSGCPEDVTEDGMVDVNDLLLVLSNWS